LKRLESCCVGGRSIRRPFVNMLLLLLLLPLPLLLLLLMAVVVV
jgi:hypothetical protein